MQERMCPVWVGYLLASPLRRLIQNPDRILAHCIKPGMTVLDAGCAMGFFSLPAARLAGEQGRVVCVDCQEKMLIELKRRAIRAGLGRRVAPHLCSRDSLRLKAYEDKVDFALAMMMVHEVPSQKVFFEEVGQTLRHGAPLLLAEPKGHVSQEAFEKTLITAMKHGFVLAERPSILRARCALLRKA